MLCECGMDRCLERLEVPVSVYEDVVDLTGRRFVVAPGHQRPDLDLLVAESSEYSVVEIGAVDRRQRGAALLRVAPTGPLGRAE